MKDAVYCAKTATMHPRTPIFLGNPGKAISPIPWWGSLTVLVIGIVSWCVSSCFHVQGLDEASRAMVYIPLTNIFNMSRNLRSNSE